MRITFGNATFLLVLAATMANLVSCEGTIRAAAARREDEHTLAPARGQDEAECVPNPHANNGCCEPPRSENEDPVCFCIKGYYGPTCSDTDDDLTSELSHPIINAGGETENVTFSLVDQDQDQDQDPAHRNLQEKIADWACLIPGDSNLKGTVKINWGYQQGDATWACNAWRPACGKRCTALPIKESTWDCYNRDPMLHRGTVTIWWGHQPSDGAWACNQWKTDCKGGKCYVREVKNVVDRTNNRRWDYPPSNACTGNGGSCRAVMLRNGVQFTLSSFKNDATWAKVEGCGGAISFQNGQVNSDGGVTVSLGSSASYASGWEGCCALTGDTLRSRGLMTDGWKCAKNSNFLAVEINLIGKDACWKQNTRCLEGTTCNFCCNGSRWVWNWFGHHCN